MLTLSCMIVLTACMEIAPPDAILGNGPPVVSAGGVTDSALRIDRTVGGYLAVGSTIELTSNYSSDRNRRGVATVRWLSSDPAVLPVGNSTGIVRALKAGEAILSAQHAAAGTDTLSLVVIDTFPISVSPASAQVEVGDSISFTADVHAPVEWLSTDITLITVDNSGRAVAAGSGSVSIIAISPIGTRGVVNVQITPKGGIGIPPVDSTKLPPPPFGDTTSVPPSDTTYVQPPPPTQGQSSAELPRVYLHDMLSEARSASVLRTITVSTASQLHAALDTSKYGDEIVVNPGTYVGTFVLRNKSGSGWITVRGKTNPSLPAPGVRVRPSHAGSLPKLHASGNGIPVIQTAPGASGYRLVHLEVSAPASVSVNYSLVALGTSGTDQSRLEQVPQNLILDRVYVHGHPNLNFQRCVSVQSGYTAIVDSWISECHGKGMDSQAILGYNGPGPYMIVNNHLEGAGENVMFGGADPSIPGLLPSDIEIRHNYFYKPPEWNGVWTAKNLLELKLGKRVLIEDNILENSWPNGQIGYAVLFKSVNQSNSAPWSETADVTFRYNIVRNASHGLTLAGAPEANPAVQMSRVYVGHNSFERVGFGDYSGGRLWSVDEVDYTTFEHNSGVAPYWGLYLSGSSQGLRILNNVFGLSEMRYDSWTLSITGDGTTGASTLSRYAPGAIVSGNVLTGAPGSGFPSGNIWPASGPPGLGVVSFPNSLRFLPSSPYINSGVGGVMPGVDFDELARRTSGVIVPP